MAINPKPERMCPTGRVTKAVGAETVVWMIIIMKYGTQAVSSDLDSLILYIIFIFQ